MDGGRLGDRGCKVKIVHGKITEATRDEMFDYYLTRDWDTVMPFAEFLRMCKENGTKITDREEGGAK